MTNKRTTIIQWRCFIEAVSCGSMLKASEILQMEVSEVSQQIKALASARKKSTRSSSNVGRPKKIKCCQRAHSCSWRSLSKKDGKKDKFASCRSGVHWKIVFGLDWTIRKGVGRDNIYWSYSVCWKLTLRFMELRFVHLQRYAAQWTNHCTGIMRSRKSNLCFSESF